MKKMKTRSKVLLFILGIVFLVMVILINWNNFIYITSPKYEYNSNGYSTGSTIDIDGVIYEEINSNKYEAILIDWPSNRGRYGAAIGKITYDNGAINGEYIIYGNRSIENRILLKANSIVIINDSIYPEVYFCRQDILDAIEATETK